MQPIQPLKPGFYCPLCGAGIPQQHIFNYETATKIVCPTHGVLLVTIEDEEDESD